MNVYQKIQKIKVLLAQANLKKSGLNKFAGFKYFELGDFLPFIMNECDKSGLFTQIDFMGNEATLTIINTEKPEERVTFSSQFVIPSMKGANEAQQLGSAQTYIRRYLFVNAFDIIESDSFDAVIGKSNTIELINLINKATTRDEINQILVGVLLEKENQNLKRALNTKAQSLNLVYNTNTKNYEGQ
ncbi:MAG: ERF family protein [Culicoidibacterales bacterium]